MATSANTVNTSSVNRPTAETGQHVGDHSRSTAQQAGDATESVRQNINSTADSLFSSGHNDDQHSHVTTTPNSTRTTGLVSEHDTSRVHPGDHDRMAHHEGYEHESTGIHPDAKKTLDGMAKGAGALGGKLENFMDKHRKH